MDNYEQLVKALQAEVKRLNMRCADCEYGNSEWPEDPEHTKLPKQGEWLIHSTGGSMATKKCPFCGSESWQSKEYAKVPKYCGNCGAHLPTFDIVDWVDYLYAKTEVHE